MPEYVLVIQVREVTFENNGEILVPIARLIVPEANIEVRSTLGRVQVQRLNEITYKDSEVVMTGTMSRDTLDQLLEFRELHDTLHDVLWIFFGVCSALNTAQVSPLGEDKTPDSEPEEEPTVILG